MQDAQQTVRLLQITDCHLSADSNWQLAGVKTQQSFEHVLELSSQRWPNFDLAIFTGDLVHDASVTGYQRFKQHLEQLPGPSVCLAGNHDKTSVLEENLNGEQVSTPKVVHLGPWLIVLLDSSTGHGEAGQLDANELAQLRSTLEQNDKQFVLVCLHHHPVPVGSRWIDNMALQNPDQLFDVVDQFSQVKGIIWGHVHQAFDTTRKQVRMLGTPSTCLQFTPQQNDFGVDPIAPGYRWLELHPDGSIRTEVEYISQLPHELDLSTGGY